MSSAPPPPPLSSNTVRGVVCVTADADSDSRAEARTEEEEEEEEVEGTSCVLCPTHETMKTSQIRRDESTLRQTIDALLNFRFNYGEKQRAVIESEREDAVVESEDEEDEEG
ncbi:hypothetical protein JOB18_038382 [Solea senegalensis]|uniref:Uncharacterized protein n=1 Tax=Solea senegalensis TaxID=28829 RepID=A0AAV6SP56_SOLSE|nr:hypothetical protein JOB18_038382 [Solea senegalensis]